MTKLRKDLNNSEDRATLVLCFSPLKWKLFFFLQKKKKKKEKEERVQQQNTIWISYAVSSQKESCILIQGFYLLNWRGQIK